MANTTNLCIRIDPELKDQADALFSDLGMSLTTAITVFFRQAVRENRIPFTVTRDRPNRETAAAMQFPAEKTQGYQDPEALFRDLDGKA